MYKKEFVVRWSEIDLNMHLTSAAYVKYVTDVRMNYFDENGYGLIEMKNLDIGPIVLSEKCYYFKEIRPDEKILVSLEVKGYTQDRRFSILEQRIFDSEGNNKFLAHTLVAFLDTRLRKIIEPPEKLKILVAKMPKTGNFRILKKSELKDPDALAQDIKT